MQRYLLGGAILVAIALTVYTLVEVILADQRNIRFLPKGVWVLIVLLLPILGAVLWFTIGKVKPQSRSGSKRSGPVAPDDDPEFLFRLQKQMADDENLRKLEEEFRKLSEEDDDDREPGK